MPRISRSVVMQIGEWGLILALPSHVSAERGRSSCILLYVSLLTETSSEHGADIWIDFQYNLGKGRNHLGLLVHFLGHN